MPVDPEFTSSPTESEKRKKLNSLFVNKQDIILDIKISKSSDDDSLLAAVGYKKLIGSVRSAVSAHDSNLHTFSNKVSLWVWMSSQGSANGRLKPIIDI